MLAIACQPASYAPTATSLPSPTATPAPKEVTLTLGAWRPEDVEQMNLIFDAFEAHYPNTTIYYDPISAPEYDAVLAAQLQNGAGPDVFYLRSYAVARSLYEQGYVEPLSDLHGLAESFSAEMRAPWATEEGVPYGVPFIATSHGIYYNMALFESLGLTPPTTWEELLTTAHKIQAAGYTPFANASGDPWTMAEIVFMNLAPNFIGGRAGRMAYLNGVRCFNDAAMVAAFQAVQDLAPYLPTNQAMLRYTDSQQLWLQGQAAMWLGGSWDIPFFEAAHPDFEWGVFAPPPPAGQPAYLTFHLDAGMGLNAASPHKTEARLFLEWLTTAEFAELLGDTLPGFFPLRAPAPQLRNAHANAFLALNRNVHGTDVRFAWEQLRDGQPDAYTLIQDETLAVANGQHTPQQAADALQAGLAQWFKPAQTCAP